MNFYGLSTSRCCHLRVYEAFHKLSKLQQRRLLKLAGGMSIREIARQEGTNFRTVHESVEAGRKKFKRFF